MPMLVLAVDVILGRIPGGTKPEQGLEGILSCPAAGAPLGSGFVQVPTGILLMLSREERMGSAAVLQCTHKSCCV